MAIGALVGADEFGFATAPLIVSGCIMMRKQVSPQRKGVRKRCLSASIDFDAALGYAGALTQGRG